MDWIMHRNVCSFHFILKVLKRQLRKPGSSTAVILWSLRGSGVGRRDARRFVEKKRCMLFLDGWSAVLLWDPGMCWQPDQCCSLLWRTIGMLAEFFDKPFCKDVTTLELSHWNITACLLNWGPHTAALKTMGSNSFTMMWWGFHWLSHYSWNHCSLK